MSILGKCASGGQRLDAGSVTGEFQEEEVGQSGVDEGDWPHPSQKNTGLWVGTEARASVLLSPPPLRLYPGL